MANVLAKAKHGIKKLIPTSSGTDRESALDGLRILFEIIKVSNERRRLVVLAVAIVVIIVATAFAQVRLNAWQGAFYDSLTQRNLSVFLQQLGVFGIVAGVLLVLNVGQTWVNALLRIRLRDAVAQDLLTEWHKPRRAYRMPLLGEIGNNPDQRIQDDARMLADLTADFCVGLVQSSLLLVSFVGVLWVLSDQVVLSISGTSFTIPGYMVWWAIAYALIGSALTWWVGRPLPQLNADLRGLEADFRFRLMRANESSEGIALNGGEADEQRSTQGQLGVVISKALRLAGRQATLAWVTAGYGWMALVVPFIAASPGFFVGTLSFGSLMMVAGAFTQVQQSLRWYVDNYSNIAAWEALSGRVLSYRTILGRVDSLGKDLGLIEYAEGPADSLALKDGFAVLCPMGQVTLDQSEITIARGEHVLIYGPPGCGKSTFFRAIAGLWPWGSGKIELPPRREIMFLPHLPYMPLGTLREVLTYPTPDKFNAEVVQAALKRMQLSHRAPLLDQTLRWDKEMTHDEQQRVAFVRVLLHAPHWVVEDEAMSMLDDDVRRALLTLFKSELADTTLISIGRDEFHDGFYNRVYRLQSRPPGVDLPLLLPNESPSR